MNGPSEVVFVVNEDPHTRATICRYLNDAGLETVPCGSATEYLDRSTSLAPSCAILDFNLPDMSGLDLQSKLVPLGVPTLFVVGCPDVAAIVSAFKAGAVDLLTAPLAQDHLVDSVRSALERYRRWRHAHMELAELRQRKSKLTPRELQVMRLIVSGMMNKQAALELGISEVTVQLHRGRIMEKMRARTFANLVRMAQLLESAALSEPS